MLDLADLHVRKLIDEQGPNSNPKWSPDGKQIAYATYDNQPFFYYCQSLYRRDKCGRRNA